MNQPNLINQRAFNEGFQNVMARHGLVKEAEDPTVGERIKNWIYEQVGAITKPVGEAASNFGEGMKTPALVAGVSVPTLAAIWYWHNKRVAEREARSKQASLEKIANPPEPVPPPAPVTPTPPGGFWHDLGGVTGAAAIGLPLIGVLGAYQLAEYMKNKQEALPQPDLDTILNVTPQGTVVPTQEEKKT